MTVLQQTELENFRLKKHLGAVDSTVEEILAPSE
jgi:hypothetical protein